MLLLRCVRKSRILRYSRQVIAKLQSEEYKYNIPRINANPSTHPEVLLHPPKIYAALFRSSFGVAAGNAANVAMIIAKLANTNTFCNLARIRVAELPRNP
jgi:hypothetical protein